MVFSKISGCTDLLCPGQRSSSGVGDLLIQIDEVSASSQFHSGRDVLRGARFGLRLPTQEFRLRLIPRIVEAQGTEGHDRLSIATNPSPQVPHQHDGRTEQRYGRHREVEPKPINPHRDSCRDSVRSTRSPAKLLESRAKTDADRPSCDMSFLCLKVTRVERTIEGDRWQCGQKRKGGRCCL